MTGTDMHTWCMCGFGSDVFLLKTENLFYPFFFYMGTILHGLGCTFFSFLFFSFHTAVYSGMHGHGHKNNKKGKARKKGKNKQTKKKKKTSSAGDVYVEESGVVMVVLLHTYTYVPLALVYFVDVLFFSFPFFSS